jgi:enterochelin esterase-like enzyme
LHAYGETAELMVTPAIDGERWRPPIEDVLDPVFGRVGAAPMIVVIPDGNSRYGCGRWVDSPVTGSFEQYVLHDVIPHVDATYRTLPVARSRGVFGFRPAGSAPGTSPRAIPTSSAPRPCSQPTRGST